MSVAHPGFDIILAEAERPERLCQLITRDASVALAGVEVHLVVGTPAVAVDDVLTAGCAVFVGRFGRARAVSIEND